MARDDGLSALALLHARQPQTVAPDVTQYPHAGILPASLAGAGRQRSLGAGHTARRHDRDGPVCDRCVPLEPAAVGSSNKLFSFILFPSTIPSPHEMRVARHRGCSLNQVNRLPSEELPCDIQKHSIQVLGL